MLSNLDSLYSSAFNGPTPDFPEEDAAETELREAEEHYEKQQSILNHYQHVSEILQKALEITKQVENALQNASRNGTLDTFGIGGIWAELAERDHLMRAQGLASQVDRLIKQGQALTPEVRGLQMPQIVSPEWLNVVFDNLYTDLLFQRKINESLNSVLQFKNNLILYCRMFGSSVEGSKSDVNDAANFLRSKRRGLIAVRREILTQVAEERVDAPPTYRSTSRVDNVSGQLADVSITMPRGPGEPPPPAYDIPSAPRDGPRYAPPPGPPPNRNRSQSRQRTELPPVPPTMPTISASIASETMYSPPPGPPPGHVGSPISASFSRTLSASSSASARSRSLSPHPRSPSSSAHGSRSSSPHIWNKPLPASPTFPQSPLLDGGSPSLRTMGMRSRSPSPLPGGSGSPSSPGTSQPPPHDVTPIMQFPEPGFIQHPQNTSDQPPSPGPNLGSPWRIEMLNGGATGFSNQLDNDSHFTLPPQMPSANPFLDHPSDPVPDENTREPSAAPANSAPGAEQAQQRTERSAERQGQDDLESMRSRSLATHNPFRQNLSSQS